MMTVIRIEGEAGDRNSLHCIFLRKLYFYVIFVARYNLRKFIKQLILLLFIYIFTFLRYFSKVAAASRFYFSLASFTW